MSFNDTAGLLIGIGYIWAAGHLWTVRNSFIGLRAFGYLLYPVLFAWGIIYISLPFVDQQVHQTVYVWLSRAAHIWTIFFLGLLVRYGHALRDAINESGDGGTSTE